MALYRSPGYQISFEYIRHSFQEKLEIDFQDGDHLRFPIRMFLATFDLRHLDISNEVSNQLTF